MKLREQIAKILLLSDTDDTSVIHGFNWEDLCQDFPHSIDINLHAADQILTYIIEHIAQVEFAHSFVAEGGSPKVTYMAGLHDARHAILKSLIDSDIEVATVKGR